VGKKGAAAMKAVRAALAQAQTFLDHFPNADVILVLHNHSTDDGLVLYGVEPRTEKLIACSMLKVGFVLSWSSCSNC
jgi:hypothetical protein